MPGQYESLNEKAKMIDISLRYTGGDIDKAKAMASGQYLDIVALKGKFFNSDKGESGLIVAFFNNNDEYIANVSSVISGDVSLFEKVRIFEDWKSIFYHINSYRTDKSTVDMPGFNDQLLDFFVKDDIFPHVRDMDLEAATGVMHKGLREIFGTPKIQCQIEMDTTSSLALDQAGVVIDVPSGGDQSGAEMRSDAEEAVVDERIAKVEDEAEYILEAKAIVAPVKGKYINDISIGEKIKVMLTGKDVISDKVIKALNAYDEAGGRYPINGRIKAKIPMDKSGYYIYALVAKGILAKIIEEENVKIMVDRPLEEVADEKKGDNKILFIMAIVVGFIIVCGIILLALL